MAKQNQYQKQINLILKDPVVRRNIVSNDIDWFYSIYFPAHFKIETAPFQREMIEIATRDDVTLVGITAFRGCGKSTMFTFVLPIWSVLGSPQKKNIVLIAQTQQKAQQYMQNIKYELENNDLLRRDLGPFQEEKSQWASTALVIPRFGAKIVVASVEQGIRGYRYKQHRPDLIVLDDVEDTSSVVTREARDKTWNWFTSEIIPAGTVGTRTIVVGNLLHEDCLLRRLEEKIQQSSQPWVYREYPLLDEHGKTLWPGKYLTPEAIEQEREKTMDERVWHREYLLKILPTDEQIVKPEWIHYYDDLPVGTGPSFRYTGIGIDLAISERNTADYTSMVSGRVYGYNEEMVIYILPRPVNERLSFPDAIERLMVIANTHGRSNTKLYIEEIWYQGSFIQEMERRGYAAYGLKVHGQDKATRLNLTTWLIKQGRIRFPREGCEQLLEQMIGFGKEKHDDLCDAFTTLVLKAVEDARLGSQAIQGKVNLL